MNLKSCLAGMKAFQNLGDLGAHGGLDSCR